MDAKQVYDIILRDSVQIFSPDGLKDRLFSGKKLKIKLGADPSRPDLHLGHSVVLRKLRLLQELGHEIIFVIGDFTGMIGDPSGKSKTRVPLTFEQTRKNGQSYFEQVTKILDQDKTVIAYNSSWLSQMKFEEVLKLSGKYTLARILERDDFAKRYREQAPIGLHEIFYPLMQGYDSVALECDIEVGGTDQTFNLLVGRELQRDYGQTAQEVITFPLLPGLDGIEKMSKSLDNYIGISEAPEIMFEKCMKVPDPLLNDYFRLTTDFNMESAQAEIKEDPRKAHFTYAAEIVRMYHGEKAADDARRRYEEVASGNIPAEMPMCSVPAVEIGLCPLLVKCGLAGSNSDARRLVQSGGIKVDNVQIRDVLCILSPVRDIVLCRGKGNFVKVIFTNPQFLL